MQVILEVFFLNSLLYVSTYNVNFTAYYLINYLFPEIQLFSIATRHNYDAYVLYVWLLPALKLKLPNYRSEM